MAKILFFTVYRNPDPVPDPILYYVPDRNPDPDPDPILYYVPETLTLILILYFTTSQKP
jgi:hypothetical protein